MPLIFVMQHGQRVLELKLLILNLFSHIILKRAHFFLTNIMNGIYTAFHNNVPSHGPHAERVAWILPPSAGKNKGTAVP
jgi:hypothetical protein